MLRNIMWHAISRIKFGILLHYTKDIVILGIALIPNKYKLCFKIIIYQQVLALNNWAQL